MLTAKHKFCYGVFLLPSSKGFAGLYLMHITPPSLNYPALSPSPYLRKLIHLTIFKNTTPFSPNNPANPPGISLFAREARRFQHACRSFFLYYITKIPRKNRGMISLYSFLYCKSYFVLSLLFQHMQLSSNIFHLLYFI